MPARAPQDAAMPRCLTRLALLPMLALALAACGDGDAPSAAEATEPTGAVTLLTRHLRNDDYLAFARDAAPPELHGPLAEAWKAGRTRWPLEELPFDRKLPDALQALAAPGSEARLQKAFDRQFANAHREIRAASRSLGLFGEKFIASDASLSDDERRHFPQVVAAMSAWGGEARLGDPKRARHAIAVLARAARTSGLGAPDAFEALGMEESLRRIGPVLAATKSSLREYGLDVDEGLDALEVSLVSRDGDRARVRMRYTLAGRPIEAVVAVERVGDRWYVSDFLRHAREAAAPPPPPAPTPAPLPAPPEPAASPGQAPPVPASS